MPIGPFDGVKVFSATKANDRAVLGDVVTAWIQDHPENEVIDTVVRQSSDRAFHCLTFTLFWRMRSAATASG
jgi:hypothetical protein